MSAVDVQRMPIQPLMAPNPPDYDDDFIMVDLVQPLSRLQEMLGEDKVNANEFFGVVKSLYGDDLIGRVQSSGLKLPAVMQRRHCLEVLAVIGHSVTLRDLNQLWSQVQQMPADHPIRQFLAIDAPTLCEADQVENLPKKDFQKVLQLFRNPLAFLEPQNERTLWEEIAPFLKASDKKLMGYTRYHDTMDRLASFADQTKLEFPFAPHEHLAKFVAYAKPATIQNGMIIPVFTNGENVYYKLEAHINKNGLHAYLFTPIDGKPEHPAQLVFRGTDGAQSISRDMDNTGVGKATFDRGAVVRMVEEAAERTPGGLKLEISGHSLGAADAQRAMVALVDRIVKEPATKVNDLKLFAYCSPKLDKATVLEWKTHLKTLADLETPPRIELNFAEHESDLVTKAGDVNISSANAEFVEANYLIVKSKSGLARTDKHHNAPFFQAGMFDFIDGRNFLLYQDREYSRVIAQMDQCAEKQLSGPEVEGDWKVLLPSEDAEALLINLKKLDKEKAEIEATQKGAAQHSWLVWGASMAAQPIKFLVGLVTSAL